MGNFDVASETNLAMTVVALENEIMSYGAGKLALLKYLKGQYSARVLLRNGVYNSIPEASEYRMKKKPFKLRMEPHKPQSSNVTTDDKVKYLIALLKLMIMEDLGRPNEPTVQVEDTGLVRRLPVISAEFVNPLSLRLKRDQEAAIARKMSPTDNPWLTKLHAEWVGKILYDGGHFRVVDVKFVPNKNNNRYPCWEATTEPIFRENGNFIVHDRNLTTGPDGMRVVLKSSLVGFALAEYSNGDDVDPVPLPHAAECHARFLQRQARQAAVPTSTAPRQPSKRALSPTASTRFSRRRTTAQDTSLEARQ
jgi:hypothetical protein